MLRITGGEARGRRLKGPGALAMRPTAERVREAIFDIVAARVPGAVFLDLFAGTGCVGIEALSRGAAAACFVEAHPAAARLIRHNLDLCGYAGRVYRADVRRWLAARPVAGDLVFLDPPYGDGQAVPALALAGGVLAPDGLAVVETGRREELPERVGALALIRTERYGDTLLSFYET